MGPADYLYLPAPARLDGPWSPCSPAIRAIARDFLTLAPLAPSEQANYEDLAQELNRQLDRMGSRLEAYFAELSPDTTPAGVNAKNLEYDAHFRILRAGGNPGDLLVAATIAAFRKFYQDQQQGTSLLPIEVAQLFAGAQLLVDLLIANGGSSHEQRS
jgi:hypothetical protein